VSLLADDFARCFYQADVLIVTEIYSALEDPIEGASGEMLATAIRDYGHKNVVYIPSKEEIADVVCNMSQPGDLIITLGAGDIWRVGKEIVERLDTVTCSIIRYASIRYASIRYASLALTESWIGRKN
jgi:UDP-N-acetylmuramate--alanine ligase